MPHLIPSGIEEFVDRVVPLLQERGVFRQEYAGSTLREHLGLSAARHEPVTGRDVAAAAAEAVAS